MNLIARRLHVRSLLLTAAVALVTLAALPTFAQEAADPAAAAATIDFGDKLLLFISFVVIAIGILSSGYALSISLSAYAACEKERRGTAFIPAVMPGSQGLYAFAIGFLMIGNTTKGWGDPQLMFKVALAGLLCGLPCLLSSIGQARVAASCIKSINNGQMDAGQALLTTGVPELYALVGLAAGFLVMN